MSLKNLLEVVFKNLESENKSDLEAMLHGDCDGQIAIVLDNHQIDYKVVGSYGGEDQGSDYWCVWKFDKEGEECFVKFQGWYASHYGTDYQCYMFVKPEQKTITVYQ